MNRRFAMKELGRKRGGSLLHSNSTAASKTSLPQTRLSARGPWLAAAGRLSFKPGALLLVIVCLSGTANGQPGLGSAARDQIRMLQEEKRARTVVEKKLDSQLVYALHEQHQGRASQQVFTLKPALLLEPD